MYLRPPKAKKNGKAPTSSSARKMPECRYGTACTRKDCVYRHPKKSESHGPSSEGNQRVCLAYLADLCPYGKNCMNRHPPVEEANELIYMFAQQLCRFGSTCRTVGCLYSHPQYSEVPSNSMMSAGAHEWTPFGAGGGHLSFADPTLVPQQWPKAPQINGQNQRVSATDAAYGSASGSSSLLDSAAKQQRESARLIGIKSVVIPLGIWKDNRLRDTTIFNSIMNPLTRFARVNEDSPDKCIDLHFIRRGELSSVLDVVLPQYSYEKDVWVITGTGHHRDGHQAEGVLFFAVVTYVQNLNLPFKIATDSRGFKGGILLNPS